ncbi:DUF2863 family protein [Herbaspirillum autotrophicum]|uniref:DUF2863 family protein n=1 Tax=Herbaspirillum autotrophicum TaxID=180195 RepID=UPI0009F86E5B|nr:DUF2863 family protein [Herbaspirillum autotrophicum]
MPKLPVSSHDDDADDYIEDSQIQALADLALSLATLSETAPAYQERRKDIRKIIRKSLHQQKDELLYEALERVRETNLDAYALLKEAIEEDAESVSFQRGEKQFEVNAFVIPMFVRTLGGLHEAQNFQNDEAFSALTQSLKTAQLESPDATVVLVSHAYHLDEIDAITYSHLDAMVRDAFAAMTDKKVQATLAIDRSMSGWPENRFAADDVAVELRFLLGFALKKADDPFYAIPSEEAAMDAYFAQRAQRFQQWSEQVVPVLHACLAAPEREFDVHFLYQDMFHGGKERGIAEYFMLQMMSDLDHGLQQAGVAASQTQAVIGAADNGGDAVLRVQVLGSDGRVLATAEKPLDLGRDMESEVDDASDALLTMGVKSVALAAGFDADGKALDVQPYAS